jgi:hypothetical protein
MRTTTRARNNLDTPPRYTYIISSQQKGRKMIPAAITKTYLEAREALETAQAAKEQAEAMLKEALARSGSDFAIFNNVKVAVVYGERPSYDVAVLETLVAPAVFKKATKSVIDGAKFKALVTVGDIKSDVAEAVTKVTPYEQIRVTDLAVAATTEKAKATKVA